MQEALEVGAPPRSEGRILLVDDDLVLLEVYALLLQTDGHRVCTVSDIDTALRMLAAAPFDAVLSDVSMPGGTGFDLLLRVRGRGMTLPFLLMTADPTPDDRRRAGLLGATAYLAKSASVGVLRRAVTHAVTPRLDGALTPSSPGFRASAP